MPGKKCLRALLLAGCTAAAFAFAGCSSKTNIEGVATNVQSAFQKTRPDIKEFAEQGVVAEKNNDYATAFVHYRALSLNPELTQEQRDRANEAMIEMNKKLREKATNGDAEAEKVLQNYRATR